MKNYIDDFGFLFINENEFNSKIFSADELESKVLKSTFDNNILSQIADIKNEADFNDVRETFLYELREERDDSSFFNSYLPYLCSSYKDVLDFFYIRPYYRFDVQDMKHLNESSFIKRIYNNIYNLSSDGEAIFVDDFYEIRETFILSEIETNFFINDLKSIKNFSDKFDLKSDYNRKVVIIREN